MIRDSRTRRQLVARCLPALAVCILPVLFACGGGGGGGSPTSTPTPVTETFSGTTTSTGPGSCSPGDTHDFNVAAGTTVQVTLTQSGDAAGLMVQVCAGGQGTSDCTITRQSIAIGATLSGVRSGGEVQNLSFIRKGCAGTEPFVAGPTTFTATLSYQRP